MSKPIIDQFQSLFTDLIGYIKEGVESMMLKAIDKISSALSSIFSFLFYGFLFVLFFLFLNIGIALFIGEMLGKLFLGFIIVAAFYALIGLVLFFLRKRLFKSFFVNRLVRKIYKK